MADRLWPGDLMSSRSDSRLREVVGDKAAQLISLYRDLQEIGQSFPGYSVVGVAALDAYYARHDICRVPVELPQLPGALTVPTPALQIAGKFGPHLQRLLADRDGRATVLRSSLLWPTSASHLLPGLDNTHFAPAWPSSGATNVVARLYKAYTTCCLDLAGLPTDLPRRAGFVVMDVVPRPCWQGTAYVLPDNIVVQLARWAGASPALTYHDVRALYELGPLPGRDAKRLIGVLVDLANRQKTAKQGRCLEIEVVIDEDGCPWILQCRPLPANDGIFHTPGRYEGRVHDLRARDRLQTEDLDNLLASCVGHAVVIKLLDDGLLDAFALALRLRRTGMPAPGALLLAAQPGSRSGMPIHLPWLLRRMMPGTMLAVLDDPDITLNGEDWIRLESDGVEVELRPLRGVSPHDS
jgi:hypothetical protein